MKVTGVSLHYYNDKQNSDKYYRMFYYQRFTDLRWVLVQHWGRDGSAGQMKEVVCHSEQLVDKTMTAKVQEQTKKGYQVLGSGTFNTPDMSSLHVISVKVRDWGREMKKVPSNIQFVIFEEDDLTDHFECSETTEPPSPKLATTTS